MTWELRLGALGLLGMVAAVFTLVALAASFVAPLRAVWACVVVRVAGSWIAAIGLLLLGWGLRRGGLITGGHPCCSSS